MNAFFCLITFGRVDNGSTIKKSPNALIIGIFIYSVITFNSIVHAKHACMDDFRHCLDDRKTYVWSTHLGFSCAGAFLCWDSPGLLLSKRNISRIIFALNESSPMNQHYLSPSNTTMPNGGQEFMFIFTNMITFMAADSLAGVHREDSILVRNVHETMPSLQSH